MSLRTKILFILLGVAVVYTAVDNWSWRLYAPRWFEDWEIEDGRRSLAQVQSAIEDRGDVLEAKAKIWARSDEVFRLVTGRGDGIEDYLDRTAIEASDVDLFFVCDRDGRVLWKRSVDPDTRRPISVRSDFPGDVWLPAHPLRRFREDEPSRSGIMMSEHGPLLVTAFPVPDEAGNTLSEETPVPGWRFPRYGAVVLGRFLGQKLCQDLAARSGAEVDVYGQEELAVDDPRQPLLARLTSGEEWAWQREGEELHLFTSFNDLRNSEALVLEAVLPRAISARAELFANLTLLSTLASALIVVFVVYLVLRYMVLRPLSTLTTKAVEIGRTDDTTIRVGMERNDEIGQLSTEFDSMLEKLARSRQQVVKTARLAGMSQIATGVLHNVGNVLNSVNVSASVVAKQTEKLPIKDLEMMAEVLRANEKDIGTFVTQDPKGKHLLPFLYEVTESLGTQRRTLLDELRGLNGGIEHIADLVRSQQTYAVTKGVFEYATLEEELEGALHFCNQAMVDSGEVQVFRDYEELPSVKVDKHKLMEILVNLIQNARQSLDEADREDKRLTLRIKKVEGDKARIEVEDNGVGIAEGNLVRVFQHGFTTKKNGHGFGLHVSANAATEMNATLEVRSDGPGTGATFHLDIPLESRELARAA